MARPARYSWTKPMIELITTTARMTAPFLIPSPSQSTAMATPPEAIRTQMSGLWICRQRSVSGPSRLPRGSTLGPYRLRRCPTSDADSPSRGEASDDRAPSASSA